MNCLLSLVLMTNSKVEQMGDVYKLIKDDEMVVEVEMKKNYKEFSINTHSPYYDVVHEFIFENWIPSITESSAKQVKDTLVCVEIEKQEVKQLNKCLVVYRYGFDNVSVKIAI